MNKFSSCMTFICAYLAVCTAVQYGAAPSSSSYAPAEVISGPTQVYAQPALAPVLSQVAPSSYAQSAPSYAQPARSYGAPRYTVLPAGVAQLYPGQNNYRAINSPVERSTVILPVRQAEPVARLFVPQASSYGAQQGSSYGAPQGSSYDAPQISSYGAQSNDQSYSANLGAY